MIHPPAAGDFIYADLVTKTATDSSQNGHGTCVASMALGINNGVSKRSRLIPVKSSDFLDDTLSSFIQVLDSITDQRKGRSVVVYSSVGTTIYSIQDLQVRIPSPWDTIQGYLNDLIAFQVVPVVAAGNADRGTAPSKPVNTLPQLLAETGHPFTTDIFVVGSVTRNGVKSRFTQELSDADNPRQIWAPGDDIQCAGRRSGDYSLIKSGTSFAAPMVWSLYNSIFNQL